MQKSKDWTIVELINWGQNYFREKGISSPRLNIELLLCNILKIERIELYLKYDYPLNQDQLSILKEFVKRRIKNEPLQYIFGEAHFCGLNFEVDKDVLIPRPESEMLVEEVISIVASKKIAEPKILEVGTGSGCIAISIAKKLPTSFITATDVSLLALNIAQKNAQKLSTTNINFINDDFLNEFPNLNFYDIIVSNPPYIPSDKLYLLSSDILDYEPKIALTDLNDGLSFYRRFAEFMKLQNNEITLIAEIDGRNTTEVLKCFDDNFHTLEIKKDIAELDRVLIVTKQ